MTYNLTSLQIPTPIAPASLVLGGGTSGPFSTGMTVGVSHSLNQLSAQAVLLGQAGGGGYGIVSGLGLSAATGLKVAVAAGIALVDGLLELVSAGPFGAQVQVPPPYTVPDATTSFVWLTQTGAVVSATSTTPPTGARIYLGAVTAAAGAVTVIDGSGVITVSGGMLSRRTADAVAPADSPPAGMRLLTQTSFGVFLWDGVSHKALVDLTKQLLSPSVTLSLSAALSLTATSPNQLFLTATSANQNVLLPPTSGLPPGWSVQVYNVGAAHNLVIKDSTGATTYATVTPGQTVGGTAFLNASGATVFPGTWTPAVPAGSV